jgi:hypothetical protein
MEAKTGIFVLTGASASLTLRKVEEEMKKNWPLVILLLLGNFISIVPAYFLSGWWSVAATLFFILFSTGLGYFAITRVITITIETK